LLQLLGISGEDAAEMEPELLIEAGRDNAKN
jgi:hypothetical protein